MQRPSLAGPLCAILQCPLARFCLPTVSQWGGNPTPDQLWEVGTSSSRPAPCGSPVIIKRSQIHVCLVSGGAKRSRKQGQSQTMVTRRLKSLSSRGFPIRLLTPLNQAMTTLSNKGRDPGPHPQQGRGVWKLAQITFTGRPRLGPLNPSRTAGLCHQQLPEGA